jgi:RNA-directed DNA polymerase
MDRDIVTDYDNLYRAYRKAKSGKKFNSSTAKFSSMALDGINILKEQLENQTYTVAPYNRFEIFEPKQRVIESCTFKDKVVQHVFCDNILHPKLQNVFVKYNSAGQVGKGTLYALNGLKDHMEAFYDKHGLDGWILKCDIRHFFYEIDHWILEDIVDYFFRDPYAVWLNHVLIDSSENPGLPLGNQAGQVYALLMVHPVDCMITGELGIVEYGRYMDDFYLFHQNKEYLKWCLDCIRELLESLGLELNGKTQIIPFRKGIRFLGFHHYMTADGKYIRKITGENKRKIKKRLNKWVKEVKNGKMEKSKMEEKFSSWKNHALHGNCIKLVHSMDSYVEKLFKEQ